MVDFGDFAIIIIPLAVAGIIDFSFYGNLANTLSVAEIKLPPDFVGPFWAQKTRLILTKIVLREIFLDFPRFL